MGQQVSYCGGMGQPPCQNALGAESIPNYQVPQNNSMGGMSFSISVVIIIIICCLFYMFYSQNRVSVQF